MNLLVPHCLDSINAEENVEIYTSEEESHMTINSILMSNIPHVSLKRMRPYILVLNIRPKVFISLKKG